MNLILGISSHHLAALTDEKDIPASSLKVMGEPLIVRNIRIISRTANISTIKIPSDYAKTTKLVQEYFPAINIESYDGKLYRQYEEESINTPPRNTKTDIVTVAVPINSIVHHNSFDGIDNSYKDKNRMNKYKRLVVDTLIYPWHFLNAVQKILHEEVTKTWVSPNASVAKSSIIEGPCIIEDNVTIDDFCKINGPTYIGKGSSIGTSSLVRECMIEDNTKIGFSCETCRTYFAGYDEIAHLNIILDSVIGRNVWFGGFSGTANLTVTKRSIKCEMEDGISVDVGTDHFGSVVGNNCTIGTSVVLSPGMYVPANMVVQALVKTYQISKNNNIY